MMEIISSFGGLATTIANYTNTTDSIVVVSVKSTLATHGILSALGVTTTTTTDIVLHGPNIVVVAGLVAYGIYKGVKLAQNH